MEENVPQAIDKILTKLNGWIDTFIELIPNMGLSILLLILFFFLARGAKQLFNKVFSKATNNQILTSLFATIFQYVIFGLGLFIILEVLGLEKAVTSLLAGVGVVGLALGFAFQDIAANFISGIILAFRQPVRVGDVVQVENIMGKVSRTNLRVTTILTFQGQEVYVPNKMILQNPVVNFSILGKRRIDLNVGVSYSDDLPKVESLVIETIKNIDGVIDPDNLIFDFEEFGDSSINFNIRFWISYPDQPGFLAMRNKAIKAIKAAFDKNDITIPFPIRTLDLSLTKVNEALEGAAQKASQNDSKDSAS